MGLIRGSFTLMLGAISGVYVAQNYNVPDIKTLLTTGVVMVKKVEEIYRKPKYSKKDDDLHD